MNILEVKNLNKSYRLYDSNWHRVLRWLGVPSVSSEERSILRDINLQVHHGEALGIIGKNGSGKSTLLKIITGTLTQTAGAISCFGRFSAILELGMGFNPELSGRQNVVFAAGLMGFSKDEIEAQLPKIEEFAEIGEYFDQPMRTYSSGMQMRVAFSVATAWRPDLLIIDEALSVGDAYFQAKSFARIRELKAKGSALILVSHDRNAIVNICDSVVLLDNGVIAQTGMPEEVLDYYNALIAEKEGSHITTEEVGEERKKTTSGSGEAKVEHIVLVDKLGKHVEIVGVGDPVELHVRVKVHKCIDTLVLGYGIKDRLGQVIFGINTWHTEQVIYDAKTGDEYLFILAFPANLGIGHYSVQTALVDRDTHLTRNYDWQDLALIFEVVNIDKAQFAGCSWNAPEITIHKITP